MKKEVIIVPKINPPDCKIRRTWGFNPVTRVHAPTKRQRIKKMRREAQKVIKNF